jgi:apolipoprotein N-acyltransferase
MVPFRAIENRRSLIRAANTGISGCIDPVGRIITSTKLFTDATPTCRMPILTTTTIYTRAGDAFAIACLVASLGLAVWYYQIDKKKRMSIFAGE